jgi:hypothetical protein
MVLFLMVPLVLVAFAIAIGPVLAMKVVSHLEQRSKSGSSASGPVAAPSPEPADDEDEDDRRLARAA